MPLYAQLTRAIRSRSQPGGYESGTTATVRQLAVELALTPTRGQVLPSWNAPESPRHERRGNICHARNSPSVIAKSKKTWKELVDRFLEEAHAMGFSLDDLLDQLQSRRKKETKNV